MLLIKNGCVHDGRGDVRTADVLLEGAKISAVGPDLEAPTARIVDATGHTVLPGFVNPLSNWGIFGPGWSDSDHNELSEPVTPHLDVTYAFDHDGMTFQKVYTYGVTSSGVAPLPTNVLAGQGAVYKTYGRTPHAMLMKPRFAMIASISRAVKQAYEGRNVMPMTRMGSFALLLGQLEKARRYDPEKSPDDHAALAMTRVLKGEQPLFVNCAGKAEIEAVLTALEPYEDLKLVLTGAYGVNADSLRLTDRKVALVLGDQTQSMNDKGRCTDPAAVIELWQQNDQIAIGCGGDDLASGRESLLWNALWWHQQGLDAEDCLAGITSRPAELLGVADRVGAIAVGLDADLTIWSKNPLETYEARLLATYIGGENVLDKEAYASCW